MTTSLTFLVRFYKKNSILEYFEWHLPKSFAFETLAFPQIQEKE